MSKTWRMPLEVKDEPQPCCGTPLAVLLPLQGGDLDLLGLVFVGSASPSGQGLIGERSNVATVGLFGVPLISLWAEGVPWESSCPPARGTPRDQQIFFKCRCIPLVDLRMICDIIAGSLDGSGRSSKRSRVKASATFISFMANCCPMQFLDPAEKGMKAWECLCAEFSGENLRGS